MFQLPQPGPWCLSNQPSNILLLHALGDGGIALAYLVIAVLIVRFVRKRRDLKLHDHPFFYVYSAFILLCGITHGASIYTRYYSPAFEVEGYLLTLTMCVSVLAATITPRSLRYFSRQIHESRNDKQGLMWKINDLERTLGEANTIATKERREILEAARRLVDISTRTADKVDEAAEVAKSSIAEAMERMKKRAE